MAGVVTVGSGEHARPSAPPPRGPAAALAAGFAVALVPDRAADPGPAGGPGPAAQDWLRSTGKSQLAAAYAESLWYARELDLLVWMQATSRGAVWLRRGDGHRDRPGPGEQLRVGRRPVCHLAGRDQASMAGGTRRPGRSGGPGRSLAGRPDRPDSCDLRRRRSRP